MQETITLAGGCFWCTEAVFKRLKGVNRVIPGYCGGELENPTYDQVSTGETGYAEAIQIEFDPDSISLQKLFEVFFHLHDPTTLNQQGTDKGTQYRSVIFYHSEDQKQIAQKVMQTLSYSNPIVTEITPVKNFYPAEDYHQDYYTTHQDQPYCKIVIDPKIKKLYKEFPQEVKPQ